MQIVWFALPKGHLFDIMPHDKVIIYGSFRLSEETKP